MRQRRMWITMALLAATVGCAWVAWAGLIPGGGPQRSDCYAELEVQGVDVPGLQVKSSRVVACTDGDACDADAHLWQRLPARCHVAVCVGQTRPEPRGLHARLPRSAAWRRTRGSQSALPRRWPGRRAAAFIDLTVPVKVKSNGRKQPGMLALPANATAERGSKPARDRDKYVLQCLPSASCPGVAPTTTTTTLPGDGARRSSSDPVAIFASTRRASRSTWARPSAGAGRAAGTASSAGLRGTPTADSARPTTWDAGPPRLRTPARPTSTPSPRPGRSRTSVTSTGPVMTGQVVVEP